jgi:CO/xanthine dehydrogenase FAD-binding subunit
MFWDDYVRVESIDEALDYLDRLHGAGRVIAGGTDLVLQMQAGQKKASCLVDISSVSSLCGITHKNGKVCIGAATTHSQISSASLLITHAPSLSEACSQIGSPQIRNIGTLGGNIVNAQPAADSVIALLALNATCTIVSKNGLRDMPIGALFSAPGISTIDSTQDIVTEISFDAVSSSAGSAFYRLSRRKAGSLPILNCAVCLRWNSEEDIITELRIAMGPVAPTPIRLYETEKAFTSDTFSMKLMREALNKAFDEVNPRSSLRGGREYRNEMAKVLVKRAMLKALEIAGWKNGR